MEDQKIRFELVVEAREIIERAIINLEGNDDPALDEDLENELISKVYKPLEYDEDDDFTNDDRFGKMTVLEVWKHRKNVIIHKLEIIALSDNGLEYYMKNITGFHPNYHIKIDSESFISNNMKDHIESSDIELLKFAYQEAKNRNEFYTSK